MEPNEQTQPQTPEPSQQTEFDETLPLATEWKRFTRKHHRSILMGHIVKNRYFTGLLFVGILLCIIGEILLGSLFFSHKKEQTNQLTSNTQQEQKIIPPAKGMYISAFPDLGDSEDSVNLEKMQEYESLAGKKMFWVYFSNNWYNGILFPKQEAQTIYKNGNIPYIRMMPRSMLYETSSEPILTLQRIAKGDFDTFLKQWAKDAKTYAHPLMVEFGPEVNGDWQPWNAKYNGGNKNGPQRFITAYRHIIDLFRAQGVNNITWVYHLTLPSSPDTTWNSYLSYYPGDSYIDWVGVSVYGALSTTDAWQSFTDILDKSYKTLVKDFPKKPFAIVEMGAVDNSDKGNKADWFTNAFTALTANRYPQIKAVSIWHATWQQQDGTEANTRIDSSPAVLEAVKDALKNDFFIGGKGKIISLNTSVPLAGFIDSQTMPKSDQQPLAQNRATSPTQQKPQPSSFIGKSWQWQLNGLVDTSVQASMFDVDFEKTHATTIKSLHASGARVICYINVGQWEPGRTDSTNYPDAILGSTIDGSNGNRWIDISNVNMLAPIIEHRLDICKQKGFDGVDPDNLDNYARDTGFSLTDSDQISFNRWLSFEAHQRGLSIGLHNDNAQVHDLLGYFDFAITDACLSQGVCDDFSQFITFGKPVFDAEYTDNGTTTNICDRAKTMQFSVIIKNSQLDSFRQICQ